MGKVLMVVVVSAVVLYAATYCEASGGDLTGSGRDKRATGDSTQWMQAATSRVLFDSLRQKNADLRTFLDKENVRVDQSTFEDFAVQDPCKQLCDCQRQQANILHEIQTFQGLLEKAAQCTRTESKNRKLANRTNRVTDALKSYHIHVTSMCDKYKRNCTACLEPETSCAGLFNHNEEGNFYDEKIFILSTKLACYLQELDSGAPVTCTAAGPQTT